MGVREEKDAKQTKIRELIEQRNTLRDAFNNEKREYRVFQDESRRLRNEKMAESRKQDQEAWRLKKLEKDVEALDDQPYVEELTRIQQCTRFCKTLMPHDSDKKEEEKKETVFNNKDGETVLSSKKDRADEEFLVPSKAKGKKGKKQGGVDAGAAAKQKIKLNMENFGDWAFLGLDPPMYVSDLAELVTKLEEKKQHFEQKVNDWELNKEEMKRKILEGTITMADLKTKDEV